MRIVSITILAAALLSLPAVAQKRAAPKKELEFPEAVEVAKKAFETADYAAAVSALQAAIKSVQKKQRVAILAGMPKPAGYEIRDEEPEDEAANPFAVGIAAFGLTVQRHYQKGDTSIDVEVTANSALVQMVGMMFANPAMVTADGGEIVEYGAHKAILKKPDEGNVELTILMHGKHLIKVTSDGLSVDDLLAIFNQAFVDGMEKPLGK